jgi:hypothetical protein
VLSFYPDIYCLIDGPDTSALRSAGLRAPNQTFCQ